MARARIAACSRDPAGHGRGIAGARPVEGDHAEVVRQPADERMGEMTDLAAEPVDENDWRPLPPVENVQPSPLDLEKRALRRRQPLDSPHGDDGQRRQRDLERGQDRQPLQQPAHNSVHLPAPPTR